MKGKQIFVIGLVIVLLALAATTALADSQDELAEVRAATAQFHQLEAAEAAGHVLLPGLDHCFNNPGAGAMGYHYINPALLDTTVEAARPEALVYAPDANGRVRLAAVEYIVPAAFWEAEELPSLYGQSFHLNQALGVYVLHAWIWQHNPAGIFEDWNPEVSCP
jgi:hypothetical protein